MNVVPLKPAGKMPADFPSILRELAVRVEKGEVTAFVGVAVGETYEFLWPSSMTDSLMLASLLQHYAAAKFRT